MNGLIRFSLNNYYAVVVLVLTVVLLGALTTLMIPIDILPPFKSPAVQVLTFYGGMPAVSVENNITNRMERWTGQAPGKTRQESRSIIGCSIVRNYYREDIDPNGALTLVNSLASAAIPNLPPGTLPPVILPFDPTGTTPVCIVALDSETQSESILYDTARYEVRNMVMGVPGADDVMLNYQSTSFHDALYVRALLGLKRAPEFEDWLSTMAIVGPTGRLASNLARHSLLTALTPQ